MRKIVLLTMLLASIPLCGCTGGQRGLWCAHYSTGLNDCSFYSFEQCRASIAGVGGACARNPMAKQPSLR
jgi:hypothetical protein